MPGRPGRRPVPHKPIAPIGASRDILACEPVPCQWFVHLAAAPDGWSAPRFALLLLEERKGARKEKVPGTIVFFQLLRKEKVPGTIVFFQLLVPDTFLTHFS
jgi:hypothetical protein